MSSLLRRLGPWLPAIAYMALITWLSSQPLMLMHLPDFPWQDKVWHLAEYAVLGFLIAHAIERSLQTPRLRAIVVRAIVLTTIWGYLDEIHQAFVPGRTPDRLDLLADLCGAIVGSLLYIAVFRAWRSRQRARA